MRKSLFFSGLLVAVAVFVGYALVTADVPERETALTSRSPVLTRAPAIEMEQAQAEALAQKMHIEELRQRIDELKDVGQYDAALWDEYYGLTSPKHPATGHLDQGGDNCSVALSIPAVPYYALGTTVGYTNDYDSGVIFDCPYSLSTAPDVLYQYTPETDIWVNIDLCYEQTNYDTKLYVYENVCGNEDYIVACDDDGCPDYKSQILDLCLTAGNTYYIVVDGYGTASGDYRMAVDMFIPPVPGDDCSDPLEVTLPADLPYTDAGQTTCGRGNHYNETCLGYYDGGEDIIYQLTVTMGIVVDILLDPLGTTYTGICIDHVCPPGDPCMYSSTSSSGNPHGLSGVVLEPGTYYIMIDTWPSPNCIPAFDLTITEGCTVECPPEGLPEGEPVCYDGYDDQYNSGCGGDPVVFSDISCGDIICGTSGTFMYESDNYRDTDWYELVLTEASTVTWSAVGEFPVLLILIDAQSADCIDYIILGFDEAPPCDTASVVAECLPPGLYWLWIAPSVFDGVSCGVDYTATVSCEPCQGGTIQLNTDYLEFPPTHIGESSSADMIVTNAHPSEQLVVHEVTTTGHIWEVEPTSFELPPGGTQPVTVTFTPTFEYNDYGGTIEFYSSDPTSPRDSLYVVGVGCKPVSMPGAPTLLDAGSPNMVYFEIPWDDNGLDAMYAVELSSDGFATSSFASVSPGLYDTPQYFHAQRWGTSGRQCISGLEPGTAYEVRLLAKDCTESTITGPPSSIDTPPEIVLVPSELVIRLVDANTVELSWNPEITDTSGAPLTNDGFAVFYGAHADSVYEFVEQNFTGSFEMDISDLDRGFFQVDPLITGTYAGIRPFISWPPNGATLTSWYFVDIQDFAHKAEWDSFRVEIDSAGFPTLVGSSFKNPSNLTDRRSAATDFNRLPPGEHIITATVVDREGDSFTDAIAVNLIPTPYVTFTATYDSVSRIFVAETTGVRDPLEGLAEIYWPISTVGERYGPQIQFEWKPTFDSLSVLKPFLEYWEKVLRATFNWFEEPSETAGLVPLMSNPILSRLFVRCCCMDIDIRTDGNVRGNYPAGNPTPLGQGAYLGPLVECDPATGRYEVGFGWEAEVYLKYYIGFPGNSCYWGQDAKGDRTSTPVWCLNLLGTWIDIPWGPPSVGHKTYGGNSYPVGGAAHGNDDYRSDNNWGYLDMSQRIRQGVVRWWDAPANMGTVGPNRGIRLQADDHFFCRADPECPPVPPQLCCLEWSGSWDVTFCQGCSHTIVHQGPDISDPTVPAVCPGLAPN